LRAIGFLIDKCVSLQKLVKCGLPAIKRIHRIRWRELAD
jgi:hypothetical protein